MFIEHLPSAKPQRSMLTKTLSLYYDTIKKVQALQKNGEFSGQKIQHANKSTQKDLIGWGNENNFKNKEHVNEVEDKDILVSWVRVLKKFFKTQWQ